MLPACAALVIAVSASADVSPTLVDRIVDETNAIWKPAGVTLVRVRALDRPAALTVMIGEQRGAATSFVAPLGWIQFDDGRPQPQLYLSHANAIALFESARGVVGDTTRMPILERVTYLGRAMGRALAHELGHFLLDTKLHTSTGLMRANFSAAEFFMPETRQFRLSDIQRLQAAARVDQVPLVASSTTSGSSSPTSRPPASPRRGAARWSGPMPHQ
jgi:hypothetical protein